MATASLTINNQSGSNLYYYVVGPGFSVQPLQPGQNNTLSTGPNTIAIEAAPQMRIYVSSSSVLFANPGQEPIGWNITAPFSFYEYTIDGSGFSADMSSIDNWAYPIQTNITDSAAIHNFGFLNATEIAMGFAALPPGGCVTSAASGQGVGTASNLWDAPNHRFVGPMRLWQQPESPADRSGLRFRLLHQHLLERHEWRPGGAGGPTQRGAVLRPQLERVELRLHECRSKCAQTESQLFL
jgi:serralysin